ncbi:thiamine phosphate synthase [Thermoflexus sp.]|uniref:thiamine phosphate synthase n=1 Tax=Thermoflexus sp. TaxID=1969742 RepID=UPI0025E8AD4F|nr:thiamine phosphate synthase [Thermoflexus sp.]MDW8181122.1 thiamine phosphate synthase [Anaerolineae bacterium]MCS6964892.1 thiamine phosphate synthase [Thermoflexus sp.]MCS7351664.1 thiamine phosphate synthase [Thermoflexus sp.]MCX7691569.1 thiamine phosphate synthase [Thermoflexus sp.]MDW8184348.1 thiamine phosphate synthase [Anaerolineae bacterium]
MKLPQPPLLVITDRRLARRPLLPLIEEILAAGARWVMVREKDLPEDKLASLVQAVMGPARRAGAFVVVNTHASVAAACGADGVHLPQGFSVAEARRIVGPGRWVGISAHNLEEALRGAEEGADYITLSPIFPSISKPGYGPPLGLDTLREVAQAVPIPVVALGGITPENARACREAGAAGIAVLGSVMAADDPVKVIQAYLESWREP